MVTAQLLDVQELYSHRFLSLNNSPKVSALRLQTVAVSIAVMQVIWFDQQQLVGDGKEVIGLTDIIFLEIEIIC